MIDKGDYIVLVGKHMSQTFEELGKPEKLP